MQPVLYYFSLDCSAGKTDRLSHNMKKIKEQNKMKKLIAILLAVLMLASFAACTANEDPTEPATDEIVTDLVTEDNVTDGNVTDGNVTAGDVTEEIVEDETDEVVADDSAAVAALTTVWNEVVADEALISAFGAASSEDLASYFAGGDSFEMGTPAVFSLAERDALVFTFGVPEENKEDVAELASIMHAMNPNNLTAAAYVLAEGEDAAAFATALKDGISTMQFLCGAPEQLVIAEVDGIVISAFGGADIINAFNTALAANGTVLVEDAIG